MDKNFAELVERAYWQFETMNLLVTQRSNPNVREQILVVDPAKQSNALAYESTIVTSLAHAYIFNVRRMHRIINGDRYFTSTIDRTARRSFSSHMRELIKTRNINEHAFDPQASVRRNSIPTPYHDPITNLEVGSFSLDETGVRFEIRTAQLFMGKLNLTQAHLSVMRMYKIAGPAMLAKRKNDHFDRFRLLSTRQRLIGLIATPDYARLNRPNYRAIEG